MKKIASERIEKLFLLASEALKSGDAGAAKRYASSMKRISEHYKIRLPRRIKVSVCSGCGVPLIPGINCTVRAVQSKSYISYKCLACGSENHIRYKPLPARKTTKTRRS
ncbi:MAG: ribonuclease P [Candidatus Marsarchaeota archaeon]|nr:ribonuclease P [Candidatus Marsarchaeota archaeon]